VLSPPVVTQADPHCVVPLGHPIDVQVLLAHSWPFGQGLQPPQWFASELTHAPLQSISPEPQAHAPF
jgi:hypothetical protein